MAVFFLWLVGCRIPKSEVTIDMPESRTDVLQQIINPKSVFESNKSDPSPLEKQYIGLTFQQATDLAKKQGRPIRVGSVDGKVAYVTAEYRYGRITVDLQNDVVTGIAMIEGDPIDIEIGPASNVTMRQGIGSDLR